MKSLAERHAERAQRKVDNAVESEVNGKTGNIGHAVTAALAAHDAFAVLSDEQKAEVAPIMQQHMADLEKSGQPTFEMAGIGVVNPLTTSGREYLDAASAPGQSGEMPEPSFDPAQGNINGQALEQAGNGSGGNGWGSDAAEDGPPEVKASMPVADIEKIAADEGIDLTGATNNEQRVKAIEEARAKNAE